MRVPNGVLPIWSWFCRNETKAVAGRSADGSPRGWPSRVRRGLALIGETGGQRAAELRDRALGVIGVIAARLAGQQHMQRVMQIVIPLRRVSQRADGPDARLVVVVFEDQMNRDGR